MKRILWFRRDLRIEDNPLLSLGGDVLPIFIFDTNILKDLPQNDKRVSFIFSQVLKLKTSMKKKGLDLKLFYGAPIEIFSSLSKEGFDEVAASGDYDSYARQRDLDISHILPFNYLHDTYIFKPNEILKSDQTPYLVFTPFYNKAKTIFTKAHLQSYPFVLQKLFSTDYEGILQFKAGKEASLKLDISSLGFKAVQLRVPDPHERLAAFQTNLDNYSKGRDIPSLQNTSHLSIHLRFGTISIRQVLRFLAEQKQHEKETESFFRQLVFRDFYAYLLYHFPHLEKQNYKYAFKGIQDQSKFEIFCSAKTGVPIVDAGVRELLQTGGMHNRVRMICASFFTKDLLLPWQWGEKFFAQHLLDYDAASNILSWQWSAGTGIDPQPYFRIFNPYLQSKRFDPQALYIKSWLHELEDIDAKHLYDEVYLHHGTIQDYPKPMLIHKVAVQAAISTFKENR